MFETPWIIEPLAMFNAITHPSVTDLLPPGEGAYDACTQDFMVMDNVPYKRPVVDITPLYNILQAQDKSCELIYKKIGTTGLRDIETIELYGASKQCQHEFYQGALRDWANKDMETFGAKILPFFLKATRTDIGSNAWFGQVSRAATASFSTNKFNGIVTWIKYYIASNDIKAAQTYVPTAVDYRLPANYAAAYAAIDNAYAKQTELMHNLPGLAKVIYCDEATAAGYNGYLRTLGTTSEYIETLYAGEIKKVMAYNGIPIIVVPLFGPVLNDILGAGYHHMVILTIRKNFIFATDKDYGRGPSFNQALVIFYRQIDMSMYYQQFLKAGTQIALPEFIVFGISA